MATVTIKWKGNPPCGEGNWPYVGQNYFLFLDQKLFTSDVSAPILAEFVSQGPGGIGFDKTYTFSFDDSLIPDGLAEVECCHVKDVECVSTCCGALAVQLKALKARVASLETEGGLAAPSNLSAVATSDTVINLTWADNSTIETGFEVERSLNGVTGWIQVLTPSVNATSANNVGLTEGTQYFYRIRAVNDESVSAWSFITSDITPPTAPSSLVATGNGETQIDLVWQDNSAVETSFEVERSLNGVSGWAQVLTPAANATSDSDTGLDPAVEYFYRIRAIGAGGPSLWSNVDSTATVLVAPSNLVATESGATSIGLTWDDNSASESGFEVERSLDGVSGWVQVLTPAADATSDTNVGLTEGTQYFYRVRATGAGGGASTWSNIANDFTLPAAPLALVATAVSDTQIDLTWNDNSAVETSFEIERSPDGIGSWVHVLTPATDVESDSDTGLAEGTQFFYRIRAVRLGDFSAWSSVVNDFTLPAAPSALTATEDGSHAIDLAWTDNSAVETSFEVERSLDGVGGWAQVLTPAADAVSDTDSGLAAATQFFYRIRAVRSGDFSEWSNVDDATTLALPLAPSDLVATAVSSSQIDLTWTDNSADETSFSIERSLDGVGGWAEVLTPAADATADSDTGLTALTQYFYRIRAVRSGDFSAYSNVADDTTTA